MRAEKAGQEGPAEQAALALKDVLHHAEVGAAAAGATSVGAESYAAAAKSTAPRGHGVLAEKANHMIDQLLLRDAKHVGTDNAKNGPDRIVNGQMIQSKYCASGRECVASCFENGTFKYMKPDGTPMQIEVPKDLYDSAVQAMEARIRRGEVPGVTDPADAANIIRKGHLTYAQALNLARAGTIESLTYDVRTGAIAFAFALGLSAAVRFAIGMWRGEELGVATAAAAKTGLQIGGVTFAASVLSAQIGRTGIDTMMAPLSTALVERLGPDMTRKLAQLLSGRELATAEATKHLARLLRGHVVTAAVTTVILSTVDLYRLVSGSISGSQAIKNITTTAAGVAGGTAGWVAGAAAGTAAGTALPVVGNMVGGIIGGLIGAFGLGALSSWGTKSALDALIKDDAVEMARILEESMAHVASDYLLSPKEIEEFKRRLVDGDLSALLRSVYAAEDRIAFCNVKVASVLDAIAAARPRIALPSPEALSKAVVEALAEAEAESAGVAEGAEDERETASQLEATPASSVIPAAKDEGKVGEANPAERIAAAE